MDFDPLPRGTPVKRYKRFMADVVLESGDTVTAHCANTGAMLGVQKIRVQKSGRRPPATPTAS